MPKIQWDSNPHWETFTFFTLRSRLSFVSLFFDFAIVFRSRCLLFHCSMILQRGAVVEWLEGRRKYSNGHCDLIPPQIFVFILIPFNIKAILILHTKFQPKILSRSGENGEFNSFGIFSNGGRLEFSTRPNFTILKPWSLIIMHMKFKNYGCSGLRE